MKKIIRIGLLGLLLFVVPSFVFGTIFLSETKQVDSNGLWQFNSDYCAGMFSKDFNGVGELVLSATMARDCSQSGLTLGKLSYIGSKKIRELKYELDTGGRQVPFGTRFVFLFNGSVVREINNSWVGGTSCPSQVFFDWLNPNCVDVSESHVQSFSIDLGVGAGSKDFVFEFQGNPYASNGIGIRIMGIKFDEDNSVIGTSIPIVAGGGSMPEQSVQQWQETSGVFNWIILLVIIGVFAVSGIILFFYVFFKS